MKTCPVCKVEVPDDARRCPLCRTVFGATDAPPPPDGAASSQDAVVADGTPRRAPRARFWIWEAHSLVSFAAVVVVLAADLAVGFSVTWSIYPMAAVGWLWTAGTVAIFLRRRPLLLMALESVLLVGFLAVLDIIVSGRSWFVLPALPIALFAGVSGSFVAVRRRGPVLSNLAIALVLAGALLAVVELSTTAFAAGQPSLSWSILTFGCLLPIIVLLLYLQHRVKGRGEELRKFFHV